MQLYHKKEDCNGCSACANACPKQAIRMCNDMSGFCYPKVDNKLCVACGKCENVCPKKYKECRDEEKNKQTIYLGAQARNSEIRMESSSGGLFTVFAQKIIEMGGVVCAAALCEDMVVRHTFAKSEEELVRLRKTKYTQSQIGDSYRIVRKNLKQGTTVLFAGTPCQCAGLIRMLDKPYDNLYTASLVCYGVPSPKVFANYVKYLGKKHGGKVRDFSFRDKRMHDNGHTVSYVSDCEYSHSLYADPFNKLYFRNHILRPSCFACEFCTTERNMDITLGDFWGLEKVRPELDDGDGTSLVILHSEKAALLWKSVEKETLFFHCEREDVLQPRLLEPVKSGESKLYPFAGVWVRGPMFRWLERK